MSKVELSKGEQTRAAILDAALETASLNGIEGLTIGGLADKMGMSKSGVFAHFGSREELQIAVLRRYHEKFEEDVFVPAMHAPRGLPRLQMMFDLWIKRVTVEIAAGCIYIGGAVEYDDRAGAVRESLFGMINTWQQALRRAAEQSIEMGHLPADVDPSQVVFEMYGLVLALHHDQRFLKRPGSVKRAETGFARLIHSYSNREPL
jgi:AcrR family transcriptional regulator